jgi:hypothetical protein
MSGRHVIELALDLSRMPALARDFSRAPIPPNIIELMRVAAASSKACHEAAVATGEDEQVVIESARFYLQQVLFRPNADCYRILGVTPGSSRATARNHMRWLLQWLHPDRNSGLDSIYAERVLKAWREISKSHAASPKASRPRAAAVQREHLSPSFFLPWIKQPIRRRGAGVQRFVPSFTMWVVPAGLVFVLLVAWAALYYFGSEQTSAMIRLP